PPRRSGDANSGTSRPVGSNVNARPARSRGASAGFGSRPLTHTLSRRHTATSTVSGAGYPAGAAGSSVVPEPARAGAPVKLAPRVTRDHGGASSSHGSGVSPSPPRRRPETMATRPSSAR